MEVPRVPESALARRVRAVAPLAAVIMTLAFAGCGDDCECPGEGAWVYDCIGWIAPACDTYCMKAGTGTTSLIPDCCCEGTNGKPILPTCPSVGMEKPAGTSAEQVVPSTGSGGPSGQPQAQVWHPIAAPCR